VYVLVELEVFSMNCTRPADGTPVGGGGGGGGGVAAELDTWTVAVVSAVVPPLAVASTRSVWLPLESVVVSRSPVSLLKRYGEALSVHRSEPSMKKSILVTDWFGVASQRSVPEIVEPSAIEDVTLSGVGGGGGGVGEPLATSTFALASPVVPLDVVATARSKWLPSVSLVVSSLPPGSPLKM
jgi:hypothetical protein